MAYNGAESPQLETVFGPDGSVVQSPLPLPAGQRLYATTTESEFGADRVYTGETYTVPARRDPPQLTPGGTRSVLRRSMSSRTGGFGLAQEETPATKMKRKVSWAGEVVRVCAFPAASEEKEVCFFALTVCMDAERLHIAHIVVEHAGVRFIQRIAEGLVWRDR
jgi:hypothetical protein